MKPSSSKSASMTRSLRTCGNSAARLFPWWITWGGILSEGTLAQKRAYYEQIAHQCAQINNDNVLTLQKINDAALSTLLLRKLARCQELHLPIYLHASGPLCFNKALSPALCQAMGVLLDNAIEAAADSLYPRIIVHMDCKEKHTEIHVVNTFPATMDVDDFLRGNTVSTKAGHAGTVCRALLHCARNIPISTYSIHRRGGLSYAP